MSGLINNIRGIFRRTHFFLPIAVAILFSLFAHADSRTLTTLTLKNQLPSQVLPVIHPLLSPGSTATEFNNQLILNVTNEELGKIRQLLGAIDQHPKQLLITVSTPGSSTSRNRNIDVDGSIGNDDVRVGTGATNKGNRDLRNNDQLRIGVDDSTRRETTTGQQQVRAVEGMPAQISIGTSTPMTSSYTTVNGQRITSREYYPVNQSVSVVARIIDDRVILDIDQQNNQLNSKTGYSPTGNSQIVQRKSVPLNRNRYSRDDYNNPTIQTQQLRTQVSGRLGEWINLGGIDQSSNSSSGGFSGSSRETSSSSVGVAIRVVVLDE